MSQAKYLELSQPSESGIDAITAKVLGVAAFLAQKKPQSEAAKQRWAQLATAPFLSPKARRQELERLQKLDAAISDSTIENVAGDLGSLPPLERLTRRLDAGDMLRDADFFELKRFLYYGLSTMESADGLDDLPRADSQACELFAELMATIHPHQPPSARFHLADELDAALQQSRMALREIRRAYKDRRRILEKEVVAKLGGKFDIHARFRPVPQKSGEHREIVHKKLVRQGAWYRLTDEKLDQLQARLDELGEEVTKYENQQRRRLTAVVGKYRKLLFDIKERLVDFDLRLTRIELRRSISGCWSQDAKEDARDWLNFEGGRSPSLVEAVGANGVQPIDVTLAASGNIVIGPNMGGKSALLKLVGLVQWCAQMALPVPARSCVLADVERIVYIGSDEPGRVTMEDGLSSFAREVRRFVDCWNQARPVLWLLDEPGRGTHPEEGSKLAAEIAHQLVDRGDTVVMATHFPRLADSDGFAMHQIAGLSVDDQTLQEAVATAQQTGKSLTAVLRRFMDYSVVDTPDGQIPRDARRIARALGLEIEEGDPGD